MKNIITAFFFIAQNFNYFNTKKSNILLKKYTSNYEELKQTGITVIKDYFTKEECNQVIKEIKNTFEIKKDKILISESLDHRLTGFEKFSKKTNIFLNDMDINELIKKYECNDKMQQSTTLAANIKYKEGGKGSGNGWHRDRTFYKYRFSKAMIYLNDVNLNNGPFQYLEESHKIKNIIKFNYLLKKSYSEKWFDNLEIKLASQKLKLNISTIIANAGDLIIFDGTGVHRGKPLISGERFTLTNYYRFDPKEILPF